MTDSATPTQTAHGLSPNAKQFFIIVGAILIAAIIILGAKSIWENHESSVARDKVVEMQKANDAAATAERQKTELKAQYSVQLEDLSSLKTRIDYIQGAAASTDKVKWCKENPLPVGFRFPGYENNPGECATYLTQFYDSGIDMELVHAYNKRIESVPTEALKAAELPPYGYDIEEDGFWHPMQ